MNFLSYIFMNAPERTRILVLAACPDARERSLRAIKCDVAVCARSFDIELTTVRDFIIRFAYGIVQRFLLSPTGC